MDGCRPDGYTMRYFYGSRCGLDEYMLNHEVYFDDEVQWDAPRQSNIGGWLA